MLEEACWYAADFTPGADYTDGTQMFPSDSFAPLIARLREEKKIGGYDTTPATPAGSRFAIRPESEGEAILLPAMADVLKVNPRHVRLARRIEDNFLGNIYGGRGLWGSWEWNADLLEDSDRLDGGYRDGGGLSDVGAYDRDDRDGFVAVRPLVSFGFA